MAKRNEPPSGSWLLAEEFYERGDPAFVDELRRLSAPDRLGAFAEKWFNDSRPASRSLLLNYLDRPLNAFRHEPLVKSLFKLAEKAGDDVVMGCFLVACDRLLRRVRKQRHRHDWQTQETWIEESISLPRDLVLPRNEKALRYRDVETGERMAVPSREKYQQMRLFSVKTRRYLRRRVWRYCRTLGKQQPDRYREAIVSALIRYTDADVADGLALIDNWGLVHALFHHSPVLIGKASGWNVANGRTLGELVPAPAFEAVWTSESTSLIKLLKLAQCRPVRQWTLQMLKQHHPDAMSRLPLRDLLEFVCHEDADLSQLATDALRNSPELNSLRMEDWLKLLDDINPQTLDLLCELMTQRLDPRSVSLEQAVRLACSRPLPTARLGFTWLQTKQPHSLSECRELLLLRESAAAAIRPEMIRWLRSVLGDSPHFASDWILELLDSRHEDVRREAWDWFLAEPRASQDVDLWQKLLESPYDDLRLRVVEMLAARTARDGSQLVAWDRSRLDAELVRGLWATVLLNIHRGSKKKPRVVSQIASRLRRHPDEVGKLLPILAVALRSIRGPEWRTGLTALVQLVEQQPELQPLVQREFPELKLSAT